MKLNFYRHGVKLEMFMERVEEEGQGISNTTNSLIDIALGISDAREGPKRKEPIPGYSNTAQRSLGLPQDWWDRLDQMAYEEGGEKYHATAMLREWIRERLGIPVPEKVVRVKRDPALTAAMYMEEQAEAYNEMRSPEVRNVRNPDKVWHRIRANPTEMFLVNLCRVKGCRHSDMGLHKHAGHQLIEYADAVEAGGRT